MSKGRDPGSCRSARVFTRSPHGLQIACILTMGQGVLPGTVMAVSISEQGPEHVGGLG